MTCMIEDMCDACVRMNIQLERDNLSADDWERLTLQKQMHLYAMIRENWQLVTNEPVEFEK